MNHDKEILKFYLIATIVVSILLLCGVCFAYTDNEIVDAIYLAEGAEKAVKPFGILSVHCEGYDDCRQICLNTVRNNRKRYRDWGYKKFDTYLEFLQSRYAPTKNATNDPRGLNRHWLKNVKYFLNKGGNDGENSNN